MNQADIRERIERAPRKAAYELRDCLEEFKEKEPDWARSRQYYCDNFIGEIFVNRNGEKNYDPEELGILMPEVIKEFSCTDFDEKVREAILEYKQSLMNRKIILRSALAILATKFPQEEIDKYDIYSYSETRICISRENKYSYKTKKMTLKTLLSKIESASTIKDLMK